MQVRLLKVEQFRNLTSLTLEPSTGINIFHGPNGSGKTNLLEALFTLSLGRSQKGAADSVMISDNQDYYRLEGTIETNEMIRQATVACQRGSRRKITLDGVPIRTAELFENFCVVSLGPEDTSIVSGPPSIRRLFINLYLSQMSASYLDNLTRYRQSLLQKNAALKRRLPPEPFNDLLVSYGCKVIGARHKMIKGLKQRATELYEEVSGGETLELSYRPSVEASDWNDDNSHSNELGELFHQQIAAAAQREQAIGAAIIGPHRDELEICIAGYPARSHASQGQWRTAAVAIKLSVYEELKLRRKQPPILLLDEIFAELDHTRSHQLIDSLRRFSQIFLTTAHDPPEQLKKSARSFEIANGEITGVS